jgi:hypothetical protein
VGRRLIAKGDVFVIADSGRLQSMLSTRQMASKPSNSATSQFSPVWWRNTSTRGAVCQTNMYSWSDSIVRVLGRFKDAVVALGGRRENLDNYHRVQQSVPLIIRELRLAANHHDIRISVEAARLDPDAQIARCYQAGAIANAPIKGYADVVDYDGVRMRPSRHGVHAAVEVFTLAFRGAFHGKVFFGGQARPDVSGHMFIVA